MKLVCYFILYCNLTHIYSRLGGNTYAKQLESHHHSSKSQVKNSIKQSCPVFKCECISVYLVYFPAAAQDIELGFKETDRGVTEGDNEDFKIRRFSQSDLTDEVVLRVIPLTVSGFENYRNAHSSRIFAQSILDDVAEISDPAECEQLRTARPFPAFSCVRTLSMRFFFLNDYR